MFIGNLKTQAPILVLISRISKSSLIKISTTKARPCTVWKSTSFLPDRVLTSKSTFVFFAGIWYPTFSVAFNFERLGFFSKRQRSVSNFHNHWQEYWEYKPLLKQGKEITVKNMEHKLVYKLPSHPGDRGREHCIVCYHNVTSKLVNNPSLALPENRIHYSLLCRWFVAPNSYRDYNIYRFKPWSQ